MPSPSWFINYTPDAQVSFDTFLRKIAESYQISGFTPLNLPAVERLETLLAKGNDGEIFTLGRISNEEFEAKMWLRFDLTVPFARYVADMQNVLTFPYRRYQIQPVWRGERSQRGRYREFYQADIDIVDRESLSLDADADILATLDRTLQVLAIEGGYTVVINNRKFLEGFLVSQWATENEIMPLINIIDKVQKIGIPEATRELQTILTVRFNPAVFEQFFTCSALSFEEQYRFFSGFSSPLLAEGIAEIQSTMALYRQFWGTPETLVWNPTIARGLAYYTGNVFETFLRLDPDLGSIASGGRYENLTGLFCKKKFPGVGVSIGVSRLFGYLWENQYKNASIKSEKSIFILVWMKIVWVRIRGFYEICEHLVIPPRCVSIPRCVSESNWNMRVKKAIDTLSSSDQKKCRTILWSAKTSKRGHKKRNHWMESLECK